MMNFSLGNQLTRAARLSASTDAVVCGPVSRSWPEVLDHVKTLAGVLRELDVQTGDRVAILALNSADYFSLYFAAPWIGAITVPINIRLAASEIIYWLNDSGARVLFVDDAFRDTVSAIRDECPSVEHYVYIDSDTPPEWLHHLRTLEGQVKPIPEAQRCERDVATLFYTGGTTGRSRGVMLTHCGMLYNILQWVAAVGTSPEDRLLIAAPMFHMVAGLNCIAAGTLAAKLVILPRFEPKQVLETIEQHRITKAALVPAMVDMLISHPDFGRYDISSLCKVSYGGAPMPEEIMVKAQQKMPHVNFYQIYGQTECSGIVTCLGPEYHTLKGSRAEKRRSAGKPAIGTEIVILDENDREQPLGEVGEIAVRSPGLSPGYWKNEEETQKLYRNDWLHTGDAGYLDSDGFLYIVDRIKDMIVTGGENVYAAEVENVLYRIAGVQQCAVIGIPSEKWGEQVHAVIKLCEDNALSEDEVIEYCRQHLANYKCVRSVEFRTEDLPVSAMNKILKRELRKPYWQNRDRNV